VKKREEKRASALSWRVQGGKGVPEGVLLKARLLKNPGVDEKRESGPETETTRKKGKIGNFNPYT